MIDNQCSIMQTNVIGPFSEVLKFYNVNLTMINFIYYKLLFINQLSFMYTILLRYFTELYLFNSLLRCFVSCSTPINTTIQAVKTQNKAIRSIKKEKTTKSIFFYFY